MTSDRLPMVLFSPHGSLSMERALKQIRGLLEQLPTVTDEEVDRVNASLDDIATMLGAIER